MSDEAAHVPDKTYRSQVRALQARLFDRTDLSRPIPWRWCVFVAGIWLAFAAFNWLVLLDRSADPEARRLAFLYGPAMLFTKAHMHLQRAETWAMLYFAIPVALIGLPVAAIMQNKKSAFVNDARRHAKDQGRMAIQLAAHKLKLKGAGVPLALLHSVVAGIPQGADLGHVGIFAPSRTGKGLHLTETLLRWQGAAVVVDPKGEQYERTAAYRTAEGNVYRIGPHAVDLLDFFQADNPLELRELYTILTRMWQEREPIFLEKAYAIFEAAHLVSKATGEHMLRIVARWTNQPPTEVIKEAYQYAPGPIEKLTDGNKDELNRFASSAWGSFTAKFTPFVPFIDTITTRNVPPSWVNERCTIYICYSLDDLEAAGPLVAAIVAGLIKQKRRDRVRGPLLCAIDELPATALPNVDKYLAEVGGAGIVMLLYIQDFAQLRNIYGPDRATTIIANLHHQVYYKPEHDETASALEKKFGTEVEVYKSYGKDQEASYNSRYRPALQGTQITALPPTAVLVFSRGIKVLGERLNPFNDPQRAGHGFPAPLPIVITDRAYVTRHYNAQGKVVLVERPGQLAAELRAIVAESDAARADRPAVAAPPAAATQSTVETVARTQDVETDPDEGLF